MLKLLKKSNFYNASGELSLYRFFLLFTLLPTALATLYYSFMVSDIYVSETKFSIYNNEAQQASLGLEGLAQIASGGIKSGSLEQLLIVAEYIRSYDLLKKLDDEFNLKEIYSSNNIDSFSKLSREASNKEFLNYYRKMVTVKVNRDASIIYLKAKAFSSENAYKITTKISEFSEKFINEMLKRVKKDSLLEAENYIIKSENKIKANQTKLSNFRIRNTTLSPTEELNAKLELIKNFEIKKAEFLIEKSEKKSLFSGGSIPMRSLESKISNINEIIGDTKGEILKYQGEEGDLIRIFEMLKLDEEFAREGYKLAMLNLEKTISEQQEKNKYIVEILKPTTPDISTEPNRLRKILTVFMISFLLSGVLSLTISGIRDHIVT